MNFGRLTVRPRARQADRASQQLLLYGVLPLWVATGISDWACHRRSDISHTSGTKESAIHAAMMSEAAVPVLLGLFAEINAGVLATTFAALGLHQATAIWDVAYATSTREVTATEQHVHGLLEQVPVMAAGLMAVLHWPQARALFGAGTEEPRWGLQPKRRGLSARYRAAVLLATTGAIAIPYAEELIRCMRADGTAELPASARA